MKIITLATLKGGSGKTMQCFNIGGILAETHKVLLIDVDPQCNLSSNCGIDVSDRQALTIRDIFMNSPKNQPKATDIIVKNPILELPNLDIIPSSIMLFQIEKQLVIAPDSDRILDKFIRNNIDVLEQYDYILIDTNPSMSKFNVNAFFVADSIIISSDVSSNSISGAELFCQLWDESRDSMDKEDNITAIIIGNYDKRTNLGKELIDYVHAASFSKNLILDTIIPSTVKLKDTEISHKPVNILYPKDKIRDIYTQLVSELKERGAL